MECWMCYGRGSSPSGGPCPICDGTGECLENRRERLGPLTEEEKAQLIALLPYLSRPEISASIYRDRELTGEEIDWIQAYPNWRPPPEFWSESVKGFRLRVEADGMRIEFIVAVHGKSFFGQSIRKYIRCDMFFQL